MVTKEELYIRQTTLQEIGAQGQQKLAQTKVLVIGCGGLGNAAAVYLAASGIGVLHLVDFDKVAESNLHRQVHYKIEDIGQYKVEVLAKHIRSITPFVRVETSKDPIAKHNVFNLIDKVDYILDCTDSLPIKYLVNDACVLKGKPLIYASLYKFDGYAASFNIALSSGEHSSNLRDAFPDRSKQQVPNCAEIGTLNTIVGIMGLIQANEVLKLVTGIGKPLIDQLLIYNSLENSQFKMKLQKSSSKEHIAKIFEDETYEDPNCEMQEKDLLISAAQLKSKLSSQKSINDLKIVSVIEDTDTPLPFEPAEKVPLSKLDVNDFEVDENKEYVIICNRGISSYSATQQIKEMFPKLKVRSLAGGINDY